MKYSARALPYILLLLISITACNSSTEKNTSEEKKEKTLPKPTAETLYKANGTEPGWSIQLEQVGAEIKYNLLLDYGEIKKQGKAKLERIGKSNFAKISLLDETNSYDIKLSMQECNDVAGNVHQSSIVLRYKDRHYFGCGDFSQSTELSKALSVANQTDHYICYREDQNKDKKVWVAFNEDDIALAVKYEGQSVSIPLEYVREEYMDGGTHPTIIHHYYEIHGGKINGTYQTTHSGNWDYLEYKRAKDGKVFKWTIDHDLAPYGDKPCF